MKKYLFISFFILSVFTSTAQNNDWKIEANNTTNYVGTPVANGGIGILPWSEPFSIRHIILNHVFDSDGPRGISRVLRGINPFLLTLELDGEQITKDNIKDWKQVVDMKEATHNTSFTGLNKAEISYSICALRNMPYAGLIRVNVKALDNLSLKVIQTMEVPDEYGKPTSMFKTMQDGTSRQLVFQTSAPSAQGAQHVSASSSFLCPDSTYTIQANKKDNNMYVEKQLKKGETATFALVAAICSTRDFSDPYGESERQVVYAKHEGTQRLISSHRYLWNELWEGDIVIEGDKEAQRDVRFALYNLYSFCRAGSRLSISPMGLSAQGYNGHIFWDTEIWMFPPMLLLNGEIAESMINYRTDRLDAARKKAYIHGYKGAMFPWESDDSGNETTPTWALTGPFEHHITADVAIACWAYYSITKDKKWLIEKGYPLMKEAADFWVSRAEKNEDGTYSICNVVGANEYADGVTDNAFTNGSAIRALQDATKAAAICGEKAPKAWSEVYKSLRIHSFDDGTTREHKDYQGIMIKQADANLLGYPLGIISDPTTLRKDLAYYADKIDPENGPAMSYSVFCVQYARLGEAEKAYEMYKKSFQPNQRPPFGVIAETATSQNPYFATGAGGLLQAVINGFGGIQITDKGIIQLPSVLPPHWKKLIIKGVGPDRRTFIKEQK